MNLKEYLQFLVMLIPTLLLLVVAVVTLAFPVMSVGDPAPSATMVQVEVGHGQVVIHETEIGPVPVVSAR